MNYIDVVVLTIIDTINNLIANGFMTMNITENVSLFSLIIWTIYITIMFYFIRKIMRAVDNG